MRAIWSGAIGFGLVNIPVKIYSAIERQEPDLDMLDKKDHSHIRYMRVNEKTGKEVPWENIVKGYNLNGKYIEITNKDFEKVLPEKNKVITISDFVEVKEIDTMYYDTPYYLEPQKEGMRAYNLLRNALEKTGKIGVGSFVLRNKECLCIIKPHDDLLVLNKIRFAEQIRDPADITIKKTKTSPQEMKMAVQLINQLSEKFDIEQYKDAYTAGLMKLIKSKSKGKKTASPSMRVVHSRSHDLMDQLKASLGKKGRKAS